MLGENVLCQRKFFMRLCKMVNNPGCDGSFLASSPSLAKAAVIARVNGSLHDLDRPLEGDAELEFLDFESRDGQTVSIQGFPCACW